jgi:hypothetical protein
MFVWAQHRHRGVGEPLKEVEGRHAGGGSDTRRGKPEAEGAASLLALQAADDRITRRASRGWRGVRQRLADSTAPFLPPRSRHRFRQWMWHHVQRPPTTKPTPERFATLRNTQRGRRCFIVGTAPSIDKLDLSLISDDYIFLVNKGYLLIPRFSKIPDAIAVADPLAFHEYGSEIVKQSFTHKFLSSRIKINEFQDEAPFIFDFFDFPRIYHGFLQFDIAKPLYHAHTVVLFALQVAIFMDFDEIFFIGVDLEFRNENSHFYKSSGREQKWAKTISRSRASLMLEGFANAAAIVEEHKRTRLWNAGYGGELDCIPRVKFEDLFR